MLLPIPRRLPLLWLLIFAWTSHTQAPAASHSSTAKVLLIASYHPTDMWTQGQIAGMLETLEQRYDPFVDISIEYLYSRIPRDQSYIQRIRERIAQEYAHSPIELVITLDNVAFEFMRSHGNQLFPDSPVVFSGLNNFNPSWLDGRSNYVGIIEEQYGMADTLKLALDLIPQTEKLLIVSDRDQEIDYYLAQNQKQVPWEKFDPTTVESWESLRHTLDSHSSPSIIYLDTFSRDASGGLIDYREVIRTLKTSKHPIFASGQRYIGQGIVGGRINNAHVHGQNAAQIALKVMDGIAPADIPVANQRSLQDHFDYQQLIRFGLNTSDLPDGATIINLPAEPYKKYLSYFLAALLFIIVQMILIALLVFNIRRRKATQLELEKAKTEAEAANAAKSEFLAIISHEFRTPLNAILGFAQILEIEKDPQEQERYLHLMRSNGDQLLYLIDNLLNYIYYGQGNVKLQHGLHKLQSEFSDLRDSLQSKAEQKGLQLEFRSNNIPPVAKVDWPKLREIFTNLLDNAIKCTDAGSVTLEAHAEFTYDEKWTLHVTVTDTGCGIPDDELHRLFEPFTQADTSRTRKVEGVGLGLAICRRLVKALQGTIECQSQEGQGTRFQVTLPISVPIEEPESLTL
ncbi:ATP-binding protein [Pelagicoccus mobilis]|uniref:histidine kinase n=1 Tax=Pelagicoccus mobilis TaxID=415221 RepID=A0A934S3K7_9BACT|nr:ATP-binding protein [Pelagicoccus mobilis]MBK1880560.1 hypothetical protein [Pelagicoccus mobilis]